MMINASNPQPSSGNLFGGSFNYTINNPTSHNNTISDTVPQTEPTLTKSKTAYQLFSESIKDELLQEGFKGVEFMKEAGKRWRECGEEGRRRFADQAELEWSKKILLDTTRL